MKDYIKQFYNEGLATTFYLKPLNFCKGHIKNNTLSSIVKFTITIIYTILVLVFALIIFLDKYPL